MIKTEYTNTTLSEMIDIDYYYKEKTPSIIQNFTMELPVNETE